MRPSVEVHDALARLLEYPKEGWSEAVEEAARRVSAECPEAWKPLESFIAFSRSTPLTQIEELFTQTFDNNDERALEVGWHVFGENYTRGSFMAGMRRHLREVGVEENGELPDHLSHMLALLGRLPVDRARLLAMEIVAPAVRKVQIGLQGGGEAPVNPWSGVFGAILEVLALHDPAARTVAPAVAPEIDPAACEPSLEEIP